MHVLGAMEPAVWKQNEQVCILIRNIFKWKIQNVENMDGMYYRKQNDNSHDSS